MFWRDNLKLLMKFGFIGGIVCSLLVGFRGTDHRNLAAETTTPTQARISVPLTVKQLDIINGEVPVYLNCEESVLIVPDTLDRIPCTIKNNSRKNIRALVLAESVTVDADGKPSTELGYITIDSFIHPDLHFDSKKDGIDEKAEPQFPSARETYSGIITHVQVQIDYVEFNTTESLGPNLAGERILSGMRAGAAKYKSWLAKQYEIQGKSVSNLIRLMEDSPLTAAELGLGSASQEQGAVIYRNWLKKTYETKGAEEIRRCFNYSPIER